MQLPSRRYEEIKRTVVNVLQITGFSRYPLDCFALCKASGIRIHQYSESPKDIESFLHLSEDAFCCMKQEGNSTIWEIWYNEHCAPKRIRFSIMHELGHICLDHSNHSNLAEIEANFFATYILAPLPLINKIGLKSANEVSSNFSISEECAGYVMTSYDNWINYGGFDYKDYEEKLLSQINFVGKYDLRNLR